MQTCIALALFFSSSGLFYQAPNTDWLAGWLADANEDWKL